MESSPCLRCTSSSSTNVSAVERFVCRIGITHAGKFETFICRAFPMTGSTISPNYVNIIELLPSLK